MSNKALLTLKETMEYLGVTEATARRLFQKCEWAYKIGNKWYADRRRLEKFLEENQNNI